MWLNRDKINPPPEVINNTNFTSALVVKESVLTYTTEYTMSNLFYAVCGLNTAVENGVRPITFESYTEVFTNLANLFQSSFDSLNMSSLTITQKVSVITLLHAFGAHVVAYTMWKEHISNIYALMGIGEDDTNRKQLFHFSEALANNKQSGELVIFNMELQNSLQSTLNIVFDITNWKKSSFQKLITENFGKKYGVNFIDDNGKSIPDMEVFVVDIKELRMQLWRHATSKLFLATPAVRKK